MKLKELANLNDNDRVIPQNLFIEIVDSKLEAKRKKFGNDGSSPVRILYSAHGSVTELEVKRFDDTKDGDDAHFYVVYP